MKNLLSKMFRFSLLLISCTHILNISSACPVSFKLELLQVMFRHGDRVVDGQEIYKTDPHADTYRKLGLGQLTNVGKERQYKVGQVLRKHYGDFLGEYESEEVDAYTTNVDRTKMSLNLVLAGLYPPTSRTKWSDKIFWTPIPYNYNLTENDFFRSFTSCDRYTSLATTVTDTGKFTLVADKYRDLLDYLRESTGIEQSDFITGIIVNNNLKSAISLGLPLPDWCTPKIYEELHEFAKSFDDIATEIPELSKITAGPVIEKFLHNINDQENGESKRKIHIYSAHDLNVAPFINFHNFTNAPDTPEYGATVVVEKLRGSDNKIYLKMSTWTGVSERWIPLEFENGKREYLLSDYIDAVEWVLPKNGSTECFGRQPGSRCVG